MLPIFATIPRLPVGAFQALAALVLAASAFWTFRNVRSEPSQRGEGESPLGPLWVGAFLVAMLYVWSRNPVKLHSYGLLLIVGFLLATWGATLEARRRGYDPNVVLDLALPLLLVCIVACRALYVVLNRAQFSSPSEWVRIWDGGLSFHGAIVGAIAVIAFYGWRSGLGFWKLADAIVPSVFLGYAFGRLGCFLNGCCYGGPTDLPWATVFRVEGGPAGAFTPPSHPAQVYSVLLALGLFGVMQKAKVSPRFNRFAGQMTLLFLALYALERFVIEIFRNGATARTVLGTSWLTEAQLTSLLGLFFVALFWGVRSRMSSPQGSSTSAA
jgi:phosphatidylglycerol:prolipoprotein diacylglycerol transferase